MAKKTRSELYAELAYTYGYAAKLQGKIERIRDLLKSWKGGK